MAAHRSRLLAGLLAAQACGAVAAAETLRVGPGRALAAPSAAAAVVQDGDTVIIDPATYYDCAVWNADRLTIVAGGPGVVLTDTACQGKAAFVIRGDGVAIRGLGFARIRVPDGNGAGIRAEGGSLSVQASRFVGNEVGILAAGGTLRVAGCDFAGNGMPEVTSGVTSGAARGHDILAGRLALLRVEGSRLEGGRGRAAIESAAARTELLDTRMAGAAPLVSLLDGGALLAERNVFVLRDTAPGGAALLLAANGDQPAGPRILRDNTLVHEAGVHEAGGAAALVRDWSGPTPMLERNAIAAGDQEIVRDGAWRNAAAVAAHRLLDRLHQMVRTIRLGVAGAIKMGTGR